MALIKCSECGKEISDKASACPNCGCPAEEAENIFCNEAITDVKPKSDKVLALKKPVHKVKKFLAVLICVAVVVLFLFVPWNSMGWQKRFTVEHIGYDGNGFNNGWLNPKEKSDGNPYNIYKITNITSKNLKDVVLVMDCEDVLRQKHYRYEKSLFAFNPGEEQIVRVYTNELRKAKPEEPIEYIDYSIKYIEYRVQ